MISGPWPSGIGGLGIGISGRGRVGRGVPAVGNGLDGRQFGVACNHKLCSAELNAKG